VTAAGGEAGTHWGDAAVRRTTGSMRAVAASARAVESAGFFRRVASSPLLAKILVADVVINVVAFLVVRGAPAGLGTEIMIASLVVTVVLNAALVYWALLPLRALEGTAVRVSRGELGARFQVPPLTDRNIARIGTTLNALLDGLTADRARARALAAQVIGAGDRERAHIARELHDSTAQSLSALEMILSSALRDPAQASPERLRIMHEITVQALGEVRTLSHNVHPRVLDDLGLVAAVEYLARRTREQTRLPVRVTSTEAAPAPPAVASVLYRVAQAAVSNAVRHARARSLHIDLRTDARHVVLEVRDDGVGFDADAAAATGAGMGLFIMRERLALVDGALEIDSAPGAGTTVRARVPVAEPVA
jgi:signal transduction histidine kinase